MNTITNKRNAYPKLSSSLFALKQDYNTEVKSKHSYKYFICRESAYSKYWIWNALLHYLL